MAEMRWDSQDQTQNTSRFVHLPSGSNNEALDTLLTNPFNSRINNSVLDQEVSGVGALQSHNLEAVFADSGSSKMVSVQQ